MRRNGLSVSSIACLICLYLCFTEGQVESETQGPNTAQSVPHQNIPYPQENWSTPSRAQTDNNQATRATSVQVNDVTHYLQVTNFGFNIPQEKAIRGVLVQVDRQCDGPDCIDYSIVLVVNGTRQYHTDYCNRANCSSFIWSEDNYRLDDIGGNTDRWNTTLSPGEVNSNQFGVAVSARRNGEDGGIFRVFEVDYISITIYYGEELPPAGGSGNPINQQSESDEGGSSDVAAAVLIPLFLLLCIAGILGAVFYMKKRNINIGEKLTEVVSRDEQSNSKQYLRSSQPSSSDLHLSPPPEHASAPPPERSATPPPQRYTPQPPSTPPPSQISNSYQPTPYIQPTTNQLNRSGSFEASSTPTSGSFMTPPSPVVTANRFPAKANYRSAPNTFAPNIIFGVPLEHVKKDNNAPIPVEHCVRYLEQRGLNEEGLLRVAGNTTEIKKLKAEYDSGRIPNIESYQDLHVIGGVLKLYFRDLPQSPLLMTSGLKMAADEQDPSTCISIIQEEFNSVPEVNYNVIKRLFGFLHQLSQYADVNKMSPENIGIVFQPTLKLPMGLITALVIYYPQIFGN